MTIYAFIRKTQRLIVLTAAVKGVALAASLALLIFAVGALVDLPSGTVATIVVLSAISSLGALAYRAKMIRSPVSVALWLEETIPAMHYELVTSAESRIPLPDLERSVHLDHIQPFVTRRIAKVLTRSASMLLGASLIYLFSPATSFGRGRVHSGMARAFPRVFPPINKLASLRIRITPPAYSGLRASEQTNAASVSALAGSRVVIAGPGTPEGVRATVDGAPVRIAGDDDTWSVTLSAVKPVSIVRVAHNAETRLIVVETVPDRPPQVVLTAPLRDTTLRTPRYSVLLQAETSDDLGLRQGYFEYLIVSGTGEAFSGRTLTSPPAHFESRTGRLQARLDLAALKVVPGDLVSVRAVVRDNNTLTGPSIGTSDTRSFRIARADEYDSVSIEAAAPPPVDSSAMSQRMLILMTEALVRKKKLLTKQQLVKESDDIGFMEDRIRKRVYDILYQTDSPEGPGDTEEVESEIQAINNPDLKEAYDALWDAVRSLRIAEPAVALPPMRVALKALDRARLAKRLYLRGTAPRVVVDISRVRLTGKEKGISSMRSPQAVADSSRRMLLSGFESAITLSKSDRRLAIEQLSLLRVRALASSPPLATALRDIIDAMEQNRETAAALIRARRLLATPSVTGTPNGEWGGG